MGSYESAYEKPLIMGKQVIVCPNLPVDKFFAFPLSEEQKRDYFEHGICPLCRVRHEDVRHLDERKAPAGWLPSDTNDPYYEISRIISVWCDEMDIPQDWPGNLHPADVLDKYVFPCVLGRLLSPAERRVE